MPATAKAEPVLQTSANLLLTSIAESPLNHRRHFDQEQLEDLAASLRAHGVLQPVLVRPAGPGAYELVYGHRRFRAASLAGLKELPCTIRELSDRQVLEVALVENCRRQDIQPLEEAEAYRQLKEVHGLKVEEIADQVGKSKEAIYARLKLCELQETAKEALQAGKLTASSALEVARLEPKLQEKAVTRLVEQAAFVDDDGEGIEPVSARRAKWEVEDLVAREEYKEKRKKDAPKLREQKEKNAKRNESYEEQQKKEQEKTKLREKVARKALDLVVAKVEGSKETSLTFLRWVALQLLSDYDGDRIREARGWSEKELGNVVANLSEAKTRGLIFESLNIRGAMGCWGGYSTSLKELATGYKVDLKALEKEVAAPPAGDVVRGTCRKCGCTEEKACVGGCWWLDGTETLCSSCPELVEAKKPAKKKVKAKAAKKKGGKR